MLLASTVLGAGAVGCGSASKGMSPASRVSSGTATTASISRTVAVGTGPAGRKDSNDGDDDPRSNDDESIVDYGHAASEADKYAITALVKRYYSAAAADNGAGACSAIYAVVAETIPEDFSQSGEASGETCATVMSKLFKQRHQQIAIDIAALKVTRVRVDGQKGLALVYFGKTPEPHVIVHREGGAWKIESLFEVGMP